MICAVVLAAVLLLLAPLVASRRRAMTSAPTASSMQPASRRASSSRRATPHRTISSASRSTATSRPLCYLTRPAAAALAQVVADLEPRGLTLKVYDCYRPERAVAHFVRWARNLGDVKMKAEFYPQVDKSTLFRDGYIAARSGHSRGSTVDLTLAQPRRRHGARHGHAVRFLQPAVMAVRPRAWARRRGQPRPAGAGDGASGLSRLTTRSGGTSPCAMSPIRKTISISRCVDRG